MIEFGLSEYAQDDTRTSFCAIILIKPLTKMFSESEMKLLIHERHLSENDLKRVIAQVKALVDFDEQMDPD